MNRLQKRDAILQEDISIYDVCLTLKMAKNGSSDPLQKEDEKRYLEYLKTVEETWEMEYGDYWNEAFDYSIRGMISSVIGMYGGRKS
jgi:hypothetical protein